MRDGVQAWAALALVGALLPRGADAQTADTVAARGPGAAAVPGAPTPGAVDAPHAPPVRVTAVAGEGVSVLSNDERFLMNLSGRVQLRATVADPVRGDAQTDAAVRTFRLTLGGHVFSPDVQYRVQLALANQDYDPLSPSPVYDAWVAYTGVRDLNVRAGQFFVPFDAARVTRESSLQLVNRAFVVNEFNLDRDVGVELSSRDLFGLGGVVQYAVGVFGGKGRNRPAVDAGFLYAGRVVLAPFGGFDDNVEGDLQRRARPRLALGVGGAYNQNAARQRSDIGNPLTTGFVDFMHAGADLHFKWSGFSLLAEWLYRSSSVPWIESTSGQGATARTVREYTRTGHGYVVQAGMVLSPQAEVVGRWGQQFALGGTDPAFVRALADQGDEAGGGFNWYFAGHAHKLQADYFYLFGDNPGGGRHLARLQLQLTF